MSTTVPLLARPLCASVASRPLRVTRLLRWGVLAVAAVVALVLVWPGVWLGVAALVLPDVPLLLPGAWAEHGRIKSWTVPLYNATHLLAGPLVLGAAGLALGSTAAIGVAAGWLVHVAADRAVGYDLRDRNGDVRR